MDPNLQAAEEQTAQREAHFETEPGGKLATDSSSSATVWSEYADSVKTAFSKISSAIVTFFVEFREPLVTLLLVVLAIAVVITRAVLQAINSLPLLAPLFELVGFGYVLWFSFRYLLKRDTRQELWGTLGQFFDETFGQAS